MLTVSGNGRSCPSTGQFEITELAVDAQGEVLKLGVNFEQYCRPGPTGKPAALLGRICYHCQ